MKKNILQISKPIITHTPPIANLFSILGNNSNTLDWIMNNYINIYIHKDGFFDNFYDRNMFFHGCPWIEVIQIRREIIEKICDNIIDYVKALIDEGYYVYSVGNTEFIAAYNIDHYFSHNLMIYGYDDWEKKFYISDFFFGGKYSQNQCSYDELEKSLLTAKVDRYFINLTYGIKLKKIDFVFEMELVREFLEDHLNSANLFVKNKTRQEEEYYSYIGENHYNYFSFSKMQPMYFFGISYYNKIIEMITNNSNRLKRPLDLLLEHKVLMSKRLDFFQKNKYINDNDFSTLKNDCDELMSISSLLLTAYVKNSIYPSNDLNDRMISIASTAKDLEEKFTEKLLKSL